MHSRDNKTKNFCTPFFWHILQRRQKVVFNIGMLVILCFESSAFSQTGFKIDGILGAYTEDYEKKDADSSSKQTNNFGLFGLKGGYQQAFGTGSGRLFVGLHLENLVGVLSSTEYSSTDKDFEELYKNSEFDIMFQAYSLYPAIGFSFDFSDSISAHAELGHNILLTGSYEVSSKIKFDGPDGSVEISDEVEGDLTKFSYAGIEVGMGIKLGRSVVLNLAYKKLLNIDQELKSNDPEDNVDDGSSGAGNEERNAQFLSVGVTVLTDSAQRKSLKNNNEDRPMIEKKKKNRPSKRKKNRNKKSKNNEKRQTGDKR